MKQLKLRESIDINKVVLNFNDLDSFILSFARLTHERLISIAEKYGDEIKGLMLKILSKDPGQYELRRNGDIVSRTDSTILKLTKDMNEDFERLYNGMISKSVSGVLKKKEGVKQQASTEPEPAPTTATSESRRRIVEQDEPMPDVPVDGEACGTEAIQVVSEYEEDESTVYCVVCENIGGITVDGLSELESNVCDVIGCDCANCEFEYETIDGAFICSDDSELFDAVENGQLSGLIKVYTQCATESVSTTTPATVPTDKKQAIVDFVNGLNLTPSMPMGSICNIYYIICNKNMPNENVDYNEFRALSKMKNEMIAALKRNHKSETFNKMYEALRRDRHIK